MLVTGVGLVTPLGNSVDVTWNRLLARDRAGRVLTSSDIDHYEQLARIEGLRLHGAPVNSAGLRQSLIESRLLADFPPNVVNVWLSEPLVAMSLVAFIEAVTQARLADAFASSGRNSKTRTAVVYGSSKGGLRTAERLTELMRSGVAKSLASLVFIDANPRTACTRNKNLFPQSLGGLLVSALFAFLLLFNGKRQQIVF